MKNIVFVLVTIGIIGGIGLLIKQRSVTNFGGNIIPTVISTNNNPQPTIFEDHPDIGIRYFEFSPLLFEQKANTKRILFFYANWCPTCRPADANFNEKERMIPEGVTLIRVSYKDNDTEPQEKQLAEKYNVTYQHTFVQIDSNDNEITRWNGGQIEELLQNIK